ncbi:MAG: flagellar assembly protein A [Pseudomonadota bacterium]
MESKALEVTREIGEVAERLHLLTAAQVQAALAARAVKPLDDEHDPGLVFVEEGLLSRAQLDYVETVRRFKSVRIVEKRFGDLAVARGWATWEQVNAAMEVQKILFMKEHKEVMIGEMLVRQHVLTADQRDILLKVQHRARQEAAAGKAAAPVAAAAPAAAEPPPAAQGEIATAVEGPAATPAPAAARKPAPAGSYAISIAPDHLTAYVTLTEGASRPGVEDLRQALRLAHVEYGIDEDELQQACAPAAPAGQPLPVAHGLAPQPGQDASIEYLFELHPLKAGREIDDAIDFKDRGDVPQVEAGSVLARKQPAVDGVPGRDVHGRVLKVAKVKDARLQAGNGAQLAPDRLAVMAQVAGNPVLTASGVIAVHPEYRIDGDLGYNTGHVDFAGRVIVNGTVQQGFRVKCGELVAKEIEGGEVEASGDVLVAGGVIGARVRADGVVKTKYLHTTHVEAMGDVLVQREVVESTVETSGVFHGETCTLLASTVSAKGGVIVQEIGSPSSPPCHITVGVDERVQHQIAQHEISIAELEQALAALAGEITARREEREELEPRIGALAQVQDKTLVRKRELEQAASAGDGQAKHLLEMLNEQAASTEQELNALFAAQDGADAALAELQEKQNAAQEEMVRLRAEIVRLHDWMSETAAKPELKVQKVTYQGTVIRALHSEVRLSEDKKLLWLEEREVTSEQGDTGWQLVPKG